MRHFAIACLSLGLMITGLSTTTVSASEALRAGFDRMVKDKAFLDDINKRNIVINPMSGAKLQTVVEEVMATDAALAKKLKWATSPN